MTTPDDYPGPEDPGYDDWDPYELFPPGTTLAELEAWGLRRVRDVRPEGEIP